MMSMAEEEGAQHLCFICGNIFARIEEAESCERNHLPELITTSQSRMKPAQELVAESISCDSVSSQSNGDDQQCPSKKLKFDDVINLALIKFMKEHDDKFNSTRLERNDIYDKATSELRKINSTITRRDISTRWSRLTNRFRRYIEKKSTGKPPKFYEEMSFLLNQPLFMQTDHSILKNFSNQQMRQDLSLESDTSGNAQVSADATQSVLHKQLKKQQMTKPAMTALHRRRCRFRHMSYDKQLVNEIRLIRKQTAPLIPMVQEELRFNREINERLASSMEKLASSVNDVKEVLLVILKETMKTEGSEKNKDS